MFKISGTHGNLFNSIAGVGFSPNVNAGSLFQFGMNKYSRPCVLLLEQLTGEYYLCSMVLSNISLILKSSCSVISLHDIIFSVRGKSYVGTGFKIFFESFTS